MATTIGRYLPSGGDSAFGLASAGVILGTRAASPSTPIWVSHMGASIATQIAQPNGTFTLACYAVNTDGTPGALLGKTAEFSVSDEASGTGGLDWKEAAVLTPFVVYQETVLAILCETANWVYGRDTTGAIAYQKTGQTSPPAAWGSGTSSVVGALSVALIGETNVKPQAPDFTPDGTSTTDATPTITVFFIDNNEALPGHAIGTADKITGVRIRVRQIGVTKWDYESESAVTSAHQAARAFSIEYAGSALGGGIVEIQAAVEDAAGVWSNWSEWDSFTLIQNIGAETLTPIGKITDDTPDITFRHTGSGASTHVQHRLTSGGNVVMLGTKRSVSVAPAATGTTTAAQSGFAPIPKGHNYRLQTQTWISSSASGWDPITNGNLFLVNAPPDLPTILSPPGNWTSLPLVRMRTKDADDATSLLTFAVEILDAATEAVLFIRAATYIVGTDSFDYQMTASDITLGASRKVRGRATDPSAAIGPYSATQTLNYIVGPSFAWSSPAEGATVTVNTPTLVWVCATQAKRRVRLYRVDTMALVYDSGEQVSAVQSITIPAGYLFDSVRNYAATVEVWNASNVNVVSPARTFVVDVPAPAAAANFQASPALARFDPPSDPSVIDLSWDAVVGAKEQFVYRRRSGETFDRAVRMARITSTLIHSWRDERPESGTTYIYSHTYTQTVGGEDVESFAAEASGGVRFQTMIIQDTIDGDFERVVVRSWKGRKVKPTDNRGFLTTWSGKPIQIGDALDYEILSASWELVTLPDTGITARELLDACKRLRNWRADLSPRVVHYRDPQPYSMFAVLDLEWESANPITYRVAATLTEVDDTEGVE